jgi:hypothetical protein
MGQYDEQIARLRVENRHDLDILKSFESGSHGILALFSGLANNETREQARLFEAMIAHRKAMIAFYEQLIAKERRY